MVLKLLVDLDVVHVAPPSQDNSTHIIRVEAPEVLFIRASKRTSIPAIAAPDGKEIALYNRKQAARGGTVGIQDQYLLTHGGAPKRRLTASQQSLVAALVAAGVPFFFKQHGGLRATSGGDLLDGQQWHQWPQP